MEQETLSPQLIVTGIRIGTFELPVPLGLTELLNQSGAWGLKGDYPQSTQEYERKVDKRNGKLMTFLRRVEEKNQETA